MTEQFQFSIGDDVQYVSSSKYDYRAPGTYRIVRLRPSETPDCQYWIRSALEDFDRTAFQSELGPYPTNLNAARIAAVGA
jgi:hypothetical protein